MELLKNLLFLFFPIALIIYGCDSKHSGFSKKSDQLYVKLHQFGDTKELTLCDAFESQISIKLRLKRENKQSFDYWNNYSYQKITGEALGNESLGSILCQTKEGDSLSLIFPYSYLKESLLDDYYTDHISIPDTTIMQMELSVLRLDTKKELQDQLTDDFQKGNLEEESYLRKFLYNEGILEKCLFKHGVFIIKTKETTGDTVKYGLDLGINYKGYFLDNKLFDNTYIDSTTLYFQLGKPDQVIKGISIALGYLKEGEEARVYIPSYLGFGKRGSTDGRVPPNTPIYFDLTVSDVYTPLEIELMQADSSNMKE